MNKLLFLSIANGYGGAERSIEAIIENLKNNFEITVFASNEIHINNLEKIKNINLIKLKKGNSLFVTFGNLIKLIPYIQKNNKILINTNKGAFYLSLLSYIYNLNNKKIFIFVRDFQWKYQKFIFESLKKYNPLYLFTSQAFFDVKSYFSENINHYRIIPNFIDLKNIYIKDIKTEKKIILIPAMINRWKGIEYAIKAVLKISRDDILLKIVGKIIDEKYFNELISLSKKLNIENKVEFFPYTNNIGDYYNEASIVLNTSISEFGGPETFGRTILEAWAYKKPVIAFNCGGPKYLIKNGINGFLIPEKNIKLLKEKTELVLTDEKVYRELVENSQKELKKFDKMNIINNLKLIINQELY